MKSNAAAPNCLFPRGRMKWGGAFGVTAANAKSLPCQIWWFVYSLSQSLKASLSFQRKQDWATTTTLAFYSMADLEFTYGRNWGGGGGSEGKLSSFVTCALLYIAFLSTPCDCCSLKWIYNAGVMMKISIFCTPESNLKLRKGAFLEYRCSS